MRRSFRVTTTTTAVTNRFVTSVAMANGAYTLANSGQPTTPSYAALTSSAAWPLVYPNGRLVTVSVAQQGGTSPDDTMGTVTITGLTPNGQVATDVITPLANTIATGVVPFVSIRAPVQAGWAIDAGDTPTADNITVGHAADVLPYIGNGFLESMTVLVTAAAAVTVKDRYTGTLFALPNSFTVGHYELHLPFFGYISFLHAGASDIVYVINDDNPNVARAR